MAADSPPGKSAAFFVGIFLDAAVASVLKDWRSHFRGARQ
jgi:hypothetical protein